MIRMMRKSATPPARETAQTRPAWRWPRQVAGHRQPRNVGTLERITSGVLGGAMAACGAGFLARRGGVGGALAGAGLTMLGGLLAYRGASGRSLWYKAIGVEPHDVTATSHPLSHFVRAEQAVTINRPAAELYAQWRDVENLPTLLRHVRSVRKLDDHWTRWFVSTSGGRVYEWDSRLIEDRPDALLAWASRPDASVPNAGEVRFEPATGERGTVVRVSLRYRPPGGAVGALVAKISGRSVKAELREDLRRFKQMMEAGEIATTTDQPRGRCASDRSVTKRERSRISHAEDAEERER